MRTVVLLALLRQPPRLAPRRATDGPARLRAQAAHELPDDRRERRARLRAGLRLRHPPRHAAAIVRRDDGAGVRCAQPGADRLPSPRAVPARPQAHADAAGRLVRRPGGFRRAGRRRREGAHLPARAGRLARVAGAGGVSRRARCGLRLARGVRARGLAHLRRPGPGLLPRRPARRHPGLEDGRRQRRRPADPALRPLLPVRAGPALPRGGVVRPRGEPGHRRRHHA